jgi:hypothetical protein
MALAAEEVHPGVYDLVEEVLRQECFTATGTTLRGYRTVLRKFLLHSGKLEGWTAGDLKDYFRSEIEAGKSRTYCRWQFTALKPLFSHFGVQIPVERRIIPPPQQDELRAPAMEPDEIAACVTAAHKMDITDARDVALLAACTVWGFRRQELSELQIDRGFVKVAAAKTGAQRIHAIPPSLWPALEGYEPIPPLEVSERFLGILKVVGIKHRRGMGWHPVRRAVATALWEHGVDGPTINAYMGWSPVSAYSATRYFRPRAKDVDERVYALHPYLALW